MKLKVSATARRFCLGLNWLKAFRFPDVWGACTAGATTSAGIPRLTSAFWLVEASTQHVFRRNCCGNVVSLLDGRSYWKFISNSLLCPRSRISIPHSLSNHRRLAQFLPINWAIKFAKLLDMHRQLCSFTHTTDWFVCSMRKMLIAQLKLWIISATVPMACL